MTTSERGNAPHRGAKQASDRRAERIEALSVQRGLALLRCFTAERPARGISELANELGFSRSTTHRYATTLVSLGYLEQDAKRRYRLAPRVHDLGSPALRAMALHGPALPELERLRTETCLATGIAVLDGMDIVYLEWLAPRWMLAQDGAVRPLAAGSRLPAYCTAAGKLLLAHLLEPIRAKTVATLPFERHRPATKNDRRVLLGELQEIADDGWTATNDEESSPGVSAIAAPVRDRTGAVTAALSLATTNPDVPVRDLIDNHQPALRAAADRLSTSLAHEPSG